MDFIGLVLSLDKGKYLNATLQNKGSDLFEKIGSLENLMISDMNSLTSIQNIEYYADLASPAVPSL
jgi:hypothetical protein